jgi:tetratricopeptide (TPR) repeat protein
MVSQDTAILQLTPGQDAAIARHALNQHDLNHAAYHLAGALAGDPTCDAWLLLLDELIAHAGSPRAALQFVPLSDETPTYFGTAALRSYILAMCGYMSEAVDLLLQVIRQGPYPSYIPWVLDWRDRPGFATALEPSQVLCALTPIIQQCGEEPVQLAHDQESLEAILPLCELATAIHAENAMLWWLHSITYRKLGRYAEALSIAEAGYRAAPDYFTAIAIAMAHKREGRIDTAVAAFRRALRFQPEDAACRNDIADTLCEAGRIEEGVRWYAEVLAYEPRHEWALPSYLFYMNLLHPEHTWVKQLAKLARAQPHNLRAHELLRATGQARYREEALGR